MGVEPVIMSAGELESENAGKVFDEIILNFLFVFKFDLQFL